MDAIDAMIPPEMPPEISRRSYDRQRPVARVFDELGRLVTASQDCRDSD